MMSGGWHLLRDKSKASLQELLKLLEENKASTETLLLGYLEVKETTARAFKLLAEEQVAGAINELGKIRDELSQVMRLKCAGRIPPKYLVVRGFRTPHDVMYAALYLSLGQPVTTERLRVLSGDAVHTERRGRELRELGVDIEETTLGGADAYVLRSKILDTASAYRHLIERNIKNDRTLMEHDRDKFLALL
jgi:hypothetical protein